MVFCCFGGAYLAARNLGNYPGTEVVVHTHMRFLCNVYTFPPPPIFVTIFAFLGLLPPQMVPLLPVPNMA